MPQTPTDPTKAQVWVTGEAPNQQLEFYIPRGAKGEPGGFVDGTELGTANLNQIVTPGIYKQTTSANTTALNNYPFSGIMAILTVFKARTTDVLQIIEPGNGVRAGTVSWKRASADSGTTWSAWKAVASTRVDQTAGRAIYQWDELNNREQLIYGDTGVRSIEAEVTNGWTASVFKIRRYGQHVTLSLYVVNPAARTAAGAWTIPTGFRPSSQGGTLQFPVLSSAGYIQLLLTTTEVQPPITQTSGTGGIANITWHTNDAWPTTLPGTALGNIPNL